MSKLNLVILTLCVTGVVIFLLVFPFYVSLSVILPAVLFFLYTDYKNQQSTLLEREHRPKPSSHAGGLPSYTNIQQLFGSLWRKISLSMQKYYVGLVNQSSGNTDLSVPSHSRSPFSSNSRKLLNATGNSLRTLGLANLDENRPNSTSFYRPNGNYSFDVGLSPIRLTDSSPASDFRDLRISDRPRSRPIESSLNMRTRNQSLTPMKSSLGDPCSSRKHQNVRGSPKNIQSIAGPLLASTRYNLSLDPVAYADVTSAGLASRLVKYATDHPPTHQQQYSGPGQFPTVQLGKTSRLPVVTRNHVVGRSPVRIRIAPPEFSERRNYISPDPSHLHTSSSLDRLKEISRPDRLQDGPRKRLHAQLGEAEDEAAKKQRVGAAEEAATPKRGREEESPKDDVKTKRTKNNEIFSSLSSSRHLTTGTNKRKQSLDEWSQSGTPMPVGKQAKKSMPSPETPSNSTDQVKTPLPSQHMETEATPLTSKMLAPQVDQSPAASRTGPTPRPEVRSAPTKMTPVPMKGVLYRPSREVSGWVTAETFPESESTAKEKAKLAGEDLKNQRELDAKRRLSSMMFIVGDKEQTAQKDLSTSSSFLPTAQPVASTPTFSMSTSTPTPALSTAKPTPPTFQETSTPKTSDKHVHFADNLTQVKTFSTDSTDGSSSSTQSLFGSNKSLGQPSSSQMSEVKTNTLNKIQEPTGGSVSFAFGSLQTTPVSNVTTKTGENVTLKFGSESPNMTLNFGTTEEKKKSERDSSGGSQQTVKPSVGLSFGSNATSSSSTLPSFPIVKSSPVANTLTSTAVASGQDTSSVPVFGKSSPGSSQQLSQPSTTFSQSAPISSTTFGQTTNSPMMFGVKGADSSNPLANLGSPATASNVPLSFGQSVTSSGQSNTASSKPSFGSVSPATFGGSTQLSSGFSGLGSFNSSKEKGTASPSFAIPATTSGVSTPATVPVGSGFGSPATLSASGAFGTPTPISAVSGFGTPSTISSGGFSTPATTSVGGGFGTPTAISAVSGFGTPSTISSGGFSTPATTSVGGGFGTPSTVSASGGFGTPSTVSASGGFGTPSTVSASGGFGAPSTVTASGGFGTPSTVSASGGFGAPSTVSASGGFGAPSTVSAASGFGTPASTNTLFGFGAATTAQSQSAGFGSQTNTVQTGFGGFGASTTQTATVFGGKPAAQGGFSFGGNSATSVSSANNSSIFGGKSDKQVATPNFSLGHQNVASNAQTADMGRAPGFKIDFSQTNKQNAGSTVFGGISSASPMVSGNSFADASKQATTTAQNAFQFGGSSAKPFSFGTSASNENAAPNVQFSSVSSNAAPPNTTQNTPNVFGQSVFGSQSQQQPISTTTNMLQQKPGGLFNFGGGNAAAQQTANSFVFGGNSGTAQSGGFAFGSAASQAPQVKPTGGFAFGASSAPQTAQSNNPFGQASQSQPTAAAQAFQFGSAASSSGGFNFGSGASNTSAPAFGTGTSNNPFQMGSTPQPQPQGQGMFSIGTGSAAPRARTARLMRRQR